MSHRLGARLVAVLLPAVLLLPAAAHAEKVVTEDAIGDVQAYSAETIAGGDLVLVPAPDEPSPDILRSVAAHGDRRLSVTVHFRDLVLTGFHSTLIRVFTPGGSRFDISVDKDPGSRADASLASQQGDSTCRGLRAELDRAADLVAVSVPTSCLGAPRWVRLGVGAFAISESAEASDPDSFTVLIDDGHRDVVRETSIGKGPRIHRG